MKNSDDTNQNHIKTLESQLSDIKFELEDFKDQLKEESEKRQFYQLIADFTFGWELWFEPKGEIKYCSPSCFDLTGFTANQILSAESISHLLVYEPDVKKYNNFITNSLDQMLVNQSLEFRILTRTKQLRWCILNVRGVYNKQGKYLGIRASIQDITRLKRAMGHIHEMEAVKIFEDRSKQRLQTELNLKDRELVSFLLQLSQKNELLKMVSNQLKEVYSKNLKNTKEKISELTELLETKSTLSIDWTMIENQVEKLHPGFLNKLQVKHPSISIRDKKLCAYLRLGLSSKEVSGLLDITPKSVEIARVRLRKKLRLSTNIRLASYLFQL
ncbi:MAG: PAS domain S-box protein [Bacteroidetes bacterium]|nr:PAS domain S-box protein [Bacteroidota bacterium]